MLNKYKKFAVAFILGATLLVPFNPVLGVSYLPLVQCGRIDPSAPAKQQEPCTTCDAVKLIKNVVDLIIYVATPMIATTLFIWAGFQMLLGGANPGLYGKGKSILTNTIYGVAIVLLAWLITNTIIQTIGPDSVAKNWWQFECPAGLP